MRKIVKIVKCCETFTYVYFLLIRRNIEQSFGCRHRLTTNLPDFPHKFRHEERAKKVVDVCFFFLFLSFFFFQLELSSETENDGCCLLFFDGFPTLQAWLNERQMCLISQAAGAVKWLVLATGIISTGWL